jgi:hypothetical protein
LTTLFQDFFTAPWLDIAFRGNLVPGGCEEILKQSGQEMFWGG